LSVSVGRGSGIYQVILLDPILEKKRQSKRSMIVGEVFVEIRLVESWLANTGDCDADFCSHCTASRVVLVGWWGED
jgi:hypothetical protein